MYGLHVHACSNQDCPTLDEPVERFYKTSDPWPTCHWCKLPMKVVLQPFAVVFTGPISARYNDRSKPNANQEGHLVYERDPITKKPRPVRIETFDDQRAYCKRNGLANPKECPANFIVGADGKTAENTRGLPGTEI